MPKTLRMDNPNKIIHKANVFFLTGALQSLYPEKKCVKYFTVEKHLFADRPNFRF